MNKKWLWVIGAVVIMGVLVGIGITGKQGQVVVTSPVLKGDMLSYVEEMAEAQLKDKTVVYGVAAGLCTAVPVEVGQVVKAGEVLLTLDPQTIDLQIRESEAQLKGAQAQYEAALEPTNASDLARLKALLKSAQLAYDDAKASAHASKSLFEAGAMSKEGYDQVLTALASAEASLLTAKSNESTARSGLTENEKIQLQTQIDAFQSRVELYKSQREKLSYSAPQSGVILSKWVEAGSYIQSGQQLIEIGNPETLYFTSDLLVEDMTGIQEGTSVILSNKALGLSDLTGKITKVAPVAFSKLSDLGILQKRVSVEIALDQQVATLKAGYDLTAHFILEKKKGVLMIPESAIFDNAGVDSVFVVEQGRARLKAVETGIQEDEQIEVIKGLQGNEVVIQSPDSTLVEGAKVQIQSN